MIDPCLSKNFGSEVFFLALQFLQKVFYFSLLFF
uniref:Uncharacterized protein n=1 Tax=Rhizophora mucronata TaxID=61149 RepID=A0A2P2NC61_RHIMU